MRSLPLGLTIGLLLAATAMAGDLNPPAGPVGATMKSLDKVEPRVPISNAGTSITQPGSYYLTRDLTTPNGSAITVNASHVTIDLNGFSLLGQPGSSKGIVVLGSHSEVTVRNGTIAGWPVRGIEASGNNNCRYLDLTFAECGLDGLMAGDHSLISGCVSRDNGEDGFHVAAYSVVTNCTSIGNAGCGFLLGGSNVITNCTATSNQLDGIYALGGCHISACVATSNTSDGIFSAGRGFITANNCNANGLNGTGAGIRVSGDDNRVDGNNVCVNDYGVLVQAAGNLIVRNSASGNPSGNFNIVGGNLVGPTVTAASVPASSNPHANYEF